MIKIITGQGKAQVLIPPSVRMFGWSMLRLHLQHLDWIIGDCESGGRDVPPQVTGARDYAEAVLRSGPGTAFFTQWCREALDMSEELVEQAKQDEAAQAHATRFVLIRGGENDG